MTAEPRADVEFDAHEDAPAAGNGNGGPLARYLSDYVARVKSGQLGSVPVLGVLVLLVAFFSIAHSGFLTAYNIEALTYQAAPTIIMAMGLVFVLLLGEIDLSAGTAGGLCAAIMAVLLSRHGQSWYVSVLSGLAAGVAIGYVTGYLRAKVGIPSFVTTLATFLGFQGITLILIGGQGSIGVGSRVIVALEGLNNDFMPIWAGWTMAAVLTVGYALLKWRDAAGRRRVGLAIEPTAITLLKIVALGVVAAVFIYVMGINRILTQNAFFNVKSIGVPWSVLLILILFIVWNFVLNRTRYGRHVYAVGGNDEAARRAGIAVSRVRISVFVICSGMAALSGITAASELESVQSNAGSAGNTLLLAVGAAVIGGTSLFGGRGRIIDAVLGGLVVAVIQNGMSDFIHGANSSGWQYIVTGIVLLLAAGVDAVARGRGRTT